MPIADNLKTILEVIINGRMAAGGSNAKAAFNVFHYKRTSVAAPASKAAFNTAFQAAIVAPLLLAANVRYTPTVISYRWLNDPLDRPVFFTAAGVGAIPTDSQPSDDAVYYLFRTDKKGSNYRGNKHFAGCNEIDTTQDILTGAGLVRWQTLQTALAAPITDATPHTWLLQVVSRDPNLSNFTVTPCIIEANQVTEVLLDLNIGTMRRRRSATVR